MKWLIDNWSLLVVLISAVVLGAIYVDKFVKLPSDAQLNQIKQCLLLWVIEAEKTFNQGGLGQLKLRWVYQKFVEHFPSVASFVTFEVFSTWVDEILVQMRQLLETNTHINDYVEGENGNQHTEI